MDHVDHGLIVIALNAFNQYQERDATEESRMRCVLEAVGSELSYRITQQHSEGVKKLKEEIKRLQKELADMEEKPLF